MGIKIGNNNKISKSIIANTINQNTQQSPKSSKGWYERHPIMGGVIVSVVAGVITGVILLFSFWNDIVRYVEGVL